MMKILLIKTVTKDYCSLYITLHLYFSLEMAYLKQYHMYHTKTQEEMAIIKEHKGNM